MNTNSVVSGPVAVLNLSRSPKKLLTCAKAICSALEGNASFPNPDPSLAVLKADINALDDAETRAQTRAKGAAMARDAALKQVVSDLVHLRDYVQSVAETIPNPVAAAAVITSAFMSVKKPYQRSTPELSAKNTGVPGQVALAARTVAPKALYYWEHSLDQVSWTQVPETLKASTTVEGLPWAKVAYFRFRALTRTGKGDYSQVVSLLVQ
jgi:hypothetical protein